MKLWISLPFLPTTQLRQLAVVADEAGVDGIAIADHLGVPHDLQSDYPYADQRVDIPVETEFPEPLILAASLGAIAPNVRFMTHVLIGPLRHPLLLAKETATTAALLDGRLDLGLGVGWMQEEFTALGVDFRRRGSRLDEMLPLLKELWTGKAVEHRGKNFEFDAFAINPRPPRDITLLVGGHSDAAIDRAARAGDGWVGVNPTIEELGEIAARLDEARRIQQTDGKPFALRSGIKGQLTSEKLTAAAGLGVEGVIALPWQLIPRGETMSVEAIAAHLPYLVDLVRSIA